MAIFTRMLGLQLGNTRISKQASYINNSERNYGNTRPKQFIYYSLLVLGSFGITCLILSRLRYYLARFGVGPLTLLSSCQLLIIWRI